MIGRVQRHRHKLDNIENISVAVVAECGTVRRRFDRLIALRCDAKEYLSDMEGQLIRRMGGDGLGLRLVRLSGSARICHQPRSDPSSRGPEFI